MPKITKQSNVPKPPPKESDSAWDTVSYLKILLYGRSGTGKTTLWSTFPRPILVLVSSGGTKPGELKSIDTPENRKTIHPKVVTTYDQAMKALDKAADYATVVSDHVTGLQDMVLADILGVARLPAQKTWGTATKQTWGECTAQCKEILQTILNAPCHSVIVGQERATKDEQDSDLILPSVGVGTTPSLAGWLNASVDYICQTRIKHREEEKEQTFGTGKSMKTVKVTVKVPDKVDYCLRIAPHEVYTTKFRLPRNGFQLPPEIKDPSFDKIMELIEQAKAG